MKVEIINRSSHALPAYETIQSAGLDLRANLTEDVTLQSLERKLIPTGLYIALPSGTEAQVRPRSGLAYKQGITVLNSPGTIDADYRGEIGGSAMEAIGRQPDAYGKIQTAMLIAAALVEGFGFAALFAV